MTTHFLSKRTSHRLRDSGKASKPSVTSTFGLVCAKQISNVLPDCSALTRTPSRPPSLTETFLPWNSISSEMPFRASKTYSGGQKVWSEWVSETAKYRKRNILSVVFFRELWMSQSPTKRLHTKLTKIKQNKTKQNKTKYTLTLKHTHTQYPGDLISS